MTNFSHPAWLRELHVGQECVIATHPGNECTTITRLSDHTIWTANGRRFSRMTGNQIGDCNSWEPYRLRLAPHADQNRLMNWAELAQEKADQQDLRQRNANVQYLRTRNWAHFGSAEIQQIVDLIRQIE